jgi:hypothetical protein
MFIVLVINIDTFIACAGAGRVQCNMAKKQKVKEKVKVKETESQSPNPSPSGLDSTGQGFQPEAVAGTPAPTVVVNEEVGEKVQVGQLDQAQRDQQEERSLHPVLGTVFESNITKYKDRKTEFLTLGKNLTTQPKYPFKGPGKTPVKITLSEDGRKLIVERL